MQTRRYTAINGVRWNMEGMVSAGRYDQRLPMSKVLVPGLRCSVVFLARCGGKARKAGREERWVAEHRGMCPRSLKLINTTVIPCLI